MSSTDDPRDVPDQWHPYFAKRNIDLTYRALRREIEKSTDPHAMVPSVGTLVRALSGERRLTPRVAAAVADALGITTEKLLELRGEPVTVPFQLPARASQLNRRQRDAVLAVVYAFLDGE